MRQTKVKALSRLFKETLPEASWRKFKKLFKRGILGHDTLAEFQGKKWHEN